MRILVISNLYPPAILGGYEILCAQVVQSLRQKGYEVPVLTSDYNIQKDTPEVSRKLKLFVSFDKPGKVSRLKRLRTAAHNYRTVKQHIDEIQPDVVFFWSMLRLTPAPLRAVLDSGVPFVCTFNDENISGYLPGSFSLSLKKFLRWFADRYVMRSITLQGITFSCTTCISQLVKDNLLAKGMPIASSRVIYQGIPIERFPLKHQPGVMGAPVKLLYAGQLHPYKGVHTILAALELLIKDRTLSTFQLTIAGKGPEEYQESLQKQIEQGSLPAVCIGDTAHEHMPKLYQTHDIFIFPSIWQEPFGLTHLEAMASGLPVISTAHGGQKEFLKDGENSLTFPAEDAQALAAQIKRLMTDERLFSSLSAAGRATVQQYFTFTRYVSELEELLLEASN